MTSHRLGTSGWPLRRAGLCLAAILLAPPGLARDAAYHFRTDPIAWSACPDPLIDGLDCATYRVPLDYRRQDGPTLDLALRRMRAQGGAPVGTLFFNPVARAEPAASSFRNGTASSPKRSARPSTS